MGKAPQGSPVPWPNQQEPIDGVVPTSEVSQDPDFLQDLDDAEAETTMED